MRINLDTGNAAFRDDDAESYADAECQEVARILRALARRIESEGMPTREGYTLRDINGNACGVCTSAPVKDYSNPKED